MKRSGPTRHQMICGGDARECRDLISITGENDKKL